MLQHVQPHASGRFAAMAVQCLDGLVDRRERPIEGREELLAGGGEGDAPVRPVQQADADLRLQSLQGMAQGRRTDA